MLTFRAVPLGLASLALFATAGLMLMISSQGVSGDLRGAVGAWSPDVVCGTADPSEEEVDRIEQATAVLRRRLNLPQTLVPHLGTVRVYFHCIYANEGGTPVGLLTEADIDAQIDALSQKFDNLDFVLEGVDFTENNEWFTMGIGSPEEWEAKSALAVDPSQYLNIYSAGLADGLGGWAYFPWSWQAQTALDGVVILYSTVPRGSLTNYNQGEICVHEVGHWAGLYHTFQGRCSPLNDRVADTPAEKTPGWGCPPSRDTCRAPGQDPIHNYMDYTNDVCRSEFTAGQYTRMNDHLLLYRPGVIVPVRQSRSAGLVPSLSPRKR